MVDPARIQISRQDSSVDVEDLRIFLSETSQNVTVREVHPGPQASVDWFLPPTVDLVMNSGAAHPYLAGFLGAISASLTSATAKKIYDKFGDVVIEKLLEKFWDQIAAVYKRAKKAGMYLHRADKKIPVPPLRIGFELNHPSLSESTTLVLIFPADLTDSQMRDASVLVGRVVVAAIKRLDARSRYEARARDMIKKGRSAEGASLLTDEKYMKLRRKPSYAYRPKEKAWIDAWVLAEEKVLKERETRLREIIDAPPPNMKSDRKTMRKMLADIEKYIRDGTVR